MNFRAVVGSLHYSRKEKLECRCCPDQYIGTLSELEAAGVITTRKPVEERPVTGALIVVLESPHKKEFEKEPAPAKGNTGLLLAKHLRQVVCSVSIGNPAVILMNAVQYQCSLGCAPVKYRDEVFTAAWNNGARQDFIRRLGSLYQPDDYVLCCCTKGSHPRHYGELRQKVVAAIVESVPPGRVLRRTHPSSWYRKTNRSYEWASA